MTSTHTNATGVALQPNSVGNAKLKALISQGWEPCGTMIQRGVALGAVHYLGRVIWSPEQPCETADIESIARAIWNVRRDREGKSGIELEDMQLVHPVWSEARAVASILSAKAHTPSTEPEVLFDGYAILNALSEQAKSRTSPENVSDVLDAVVRLVRSDCPAPSAEPLKGLKISNRVCIGESFEYDGGEVEISDSTLKRCHFEFVGAAANTVRFLREIRAVSPETFETAFPSSRPSPSAEPIYQEGSGQSGPWYDVSKERWENSQRAKRVLYAAPQPDSGRVDEMEAEIDKLGDDVIQLRASRDSLLVERNSLARRVAELEQGLRDIIQSADNSREMSKRTQWIRARAQSALDGDQNYRTVPFPKTGIRKERFEFAATKRERDEACAEVERLRNALKLARRELLECQHNVGKGHVCFDGDDFHEALSAVEAALAAKGE